MRNCIQVSQKFSLLLLLIQAIFSKESRSQEHNSVSVSMRVSMRVPMRSVGYASLAGPNGRLCIGNAAHGPPTNKQVSWRIIIELSRWFRESGRSPPNRLGPPFDWILLCIAAHYQNRTYGGGHWNFDWFPLLGGAEVEALKPLLEATIERAHFFNTTRNATGTFCVVLLLIEIGNHSLTRELRLSEKLKFWERERERELEKILLEKRAPGARSRTLCISALNQGTCKSVSVRLRLNWEKQIWLKRDPEPASNPSSSNEIVCRHSAHLFVYFRNGISNPFELESSTHWLSSISDQHMQLRLAQSHYWLWWIISIGYWSSSPFHEKHQVEEEHFDSMSEKLKWEKSWRTSSHMRWRRQERSPSWWLTPYLSCHIGELGRALWTELARLWPNTTNSNQTSFVVLPGRRSLRGSADPWPCRRSLATPIKHMHLSLSINDWSLNPLLQNQANKGVAFSCFPSCQLTRYMKLHAKLPHSNNGTSIIILERYRWELYLMMMMMIYCIVLFCFVLF